MALRIEEERRLMTKARIIRPGTDAKAGDYVLMGMYALPPREWWTAKVEWASGDDVLTRHTMAGQEYVQIVSRDNIRAVAKPTAMEETAEGGRMQASVRYLGDFQRRCAAICGVADQKVAEAQKALRAATEERWALIDALFDGSPASALSDETQEGGK